MKMTLVMKQGFHVWSPCQRDFHSRLPISYLKTPRSLNLSSIFTNSSIRGVSECNARVSEMADEDEVFPTPISRAFCSKPAILFQARLLSPVPASAFVLVNSIFSEPAKAFAEACEADNSLLNMNMPLLLFMALVGAAVGGVVARQRKAELLRLNEQLRQINTALRRQAKMESYAPCLSFAPVSGKISEDEVIGSKKQYLISHLKNGKSFLRNQNPAMAFSEFKTALEIAQNLKDPVEEKKAARGLGASLQRQGKYHEAIKYHSMVLKISEREGEESGSTEAYGAIADCYTELGDLEQAANFYDQFIGRLQNDS